jgi:nucleoside-diphosphate-sugar epimerase
VGDQASPATLPSPGTGTGSSWASAASFIPHVNRMEEPRQHAPPAVIAVTGASGFIGAHLCAALGEQGISTRAVMRRRDALAPRQGLERTVASLDDRAALRDAFHGVSTLIHLGGRAHVLRETLEDPSAEFRRVNVDGTRLVIESAIESGVARIIAMSSIAAVATSSKTVITDDTPPAPDTLYGRSKLDAESVVRELAESAGIDYIILRPPMVYGPGMKGNPLRLFEAVRRGVPLPLGSVRNRRSMIYVGNLVHAIRCVLTLPEGVKETYVVGDSEPVSSAELVREIARAMALPPRLVSVPLAVMQAGGRIGDVLNRLVSSPLTSNVVERLFGSLSVEYSRMVRATGYTPIVSRADAMHLTAAWYLGLAR